MIAASKIPPLILIAVLGHAMALFWVFAARFHFKLCQNAIYAIPITKEQIKREIKNSIHTPIHAVILYIFVWLKFFTRLASTASSSQTMVGGSLMQHLLPFRPCLELLQLVGDATLIILDSGVRTGLDIGRAIMLGADFVLLGRAFLYGVAALGDRGGDYVSRLLKEDTTNNMRQLGVASFDALRHMRVDAAWRVEPCDAS